MARRYLDIKRIAPLLVIVVFTAVIGVSMISVVASADRKDQAAWDEVLTEDREMADAAREASALVDELEEVLMEKPPDSPEVVRLQAELISVWPNFGRKDSSGSVSLPTFENMRRQLNFYINRG